jgi:hypothetical protein
MPVNPDVNSVHEDHALSATGNVLSNDQVRGGVLFVRRDGTTYGQAMSWRGPTAPCVSTPTGPTPTS